MSRGQERRTLVLRCVTHTIPIAKQLCLQTNMKGRAQSFAIANNCPEITKILWYFGWCISGGDYLEGEYFWVPLLLENAGSKIRTKKSRPRFACPKLVSQNSASNSGLRGAQSPVQKCIPDEINRNTFRMIIGFSAIDIIFAFFFREWEGIHGGGCKHGSIWQNCVFNPILKGFLALYLVKTLENAGGQKIIWQPFSFPGVSQTIVESSTWGQCPQVLAGTARKVAKSTLLCSYAGGPFYEV